MRAEAGDYQTDSRMAAKLEAIPLAPRLDGLSVLDVGTDFGAWAFLAEQRGAARVLGLDRGRQVRGTGFVDLVAHNREAAAKRGSIAEFAGINLGKQWFEFGQFDIVLCLSMYHHAFANCESHEALWYWLRRHLKPNGVLFWEGPTDDRDPVVLAALPEKVRANFTDAQIFGAARLFFETQFRGPALHEPYRIVRVMTPFTDRAGSIAGRMKAGAGGATPAFQYGGGGRIDEIEKVLGFRPFPGSLNIELGSAFWWGAPSFYRARIKDVVVRGQGLGVPWEERWCRFYPVIVHAYDEPGAKGVKAWAMRFEGDRYDANFVELIAPHRIREAIEGEGVWLTPAS